MHVFKIKLTRQKNKRKSSKWWVFYNEINPVMSSRAAQRRTGLVLGLTEMPVMWLSITTPPYKLLTSLSGTICTALLGGKLLVYATSSWSERKGSDGTVLMFAPSCFEICESPCLHIKLSYRITCALSWFHVYRSGLKGGFCDYSGESSFSFWRDYITPMPLKRKLDHQRPRQWWQTFWW